MSGFMYFFVEALVWHHIQKIYQKAERLRKMINCLYVGFGGFIGTLLRYLIGKLFIFESTNLPVTTFLINSSGALLIGIISAAAKRYGLSDHSVVLLLQAGFCGGFTTFSSFSLETFNLLSQGRIIHGTCYAILSVVTCLAFVAFGRILAEAMLW